MTKKEQPKQYAESRHGKTGEPIVTARYLRVQAEALQELRNEIRGFMDANEEVLKPLLRMMRQHDKIATEIRQRAKELHTADFDENEIELGDFTLTKMKPTEKWDAAAVYKNGDEGAFHINGLVKELDGDVIVSAVHGKKLPKRFLQYRDRREHPDFRVTGPPNITPKV